MLLEWDYADRYTNPVTAPGWPRAHIGHNINPSEHFTFTTSLAELHDRDVMSAKYVAGFARLSPWWPWMRMGQSGVEATLFGRMFSVTGARGAADIPPKALNYT